jgi:FkbM family methyltransferase
LQRSIQIAANLFHKTRIAMLGKRIAWRSIGKGLQMEIDPNDYMDRLFYLGTYDRWLRSAIRKSVGAGDTCLDIGAHKGYVTLQLARAVGPTGRVYAFEPDPRARAVLEKNCARNGFVNVSILPFALGSKNGTAEFELSKQLGWSSQFPNAQVAGTMLRKIEVPVRSFDDLVDSGDVVFHSGLLSFVKIDAEGAEYHVLSGMKRTMTRWAPIVWMEINPPSLATAGIRAKDLHEILLSLGFSVYCVGREKNLFLSPRLALTPLSNIESAGDEIHDVVALKRIAMDVNLLTPDRLRHEIELSSVRRTPASCASYPYSGIKAEDVR